MKIDKKRSRKLYSHLRDVRVKFLIAGAYNTAFGYGVFVIVSLLLPHNTHYLIVLCLSFFFSVTNAYLVQKYLVFKTFTRKIRLEYMRFVLVNTASLAANAIILTVLVKLHMDPIPAQAVAIIVTTLFSYVGHRTFTFRL